jgi:predicted HTH domain antitoxin
MTLELNDELLATAGLTAEETRLELAVHLVETGRLTAGQARRLTNLERLEFERVLGERGFWPNYDEESLRRETASLQQAGLL